MHFFDRASRVIERAIAEDIDIFTDYMGDAAQTTADAGEHLRLNRQFFDDRWSRHRSVTSLDWSTEFPELLVAGYNANQEAPHEPDGVALIWNLKYKKTSPEYVFHCQSPVIAACFAPFHPNIVIGGTYSGQVALWDTRTNRRTPVQRTPLSAAGHTHPVYCVNVVGTANAHSLATISTDGRMCFWSLDMLSSPQESLDLQYKQAKSVAAMCFSFLSGDSNNFVVGSEDGAVYAGARHGARAGASGDIFEAHYGPVTGIDCHSVAGPVDLSTYFLTSSFDWTVKLWNVRDSRPLLSLEDNCDYVYDVRWSPVHPAVFAAVDGTGRLDVWNLNGDTEVPAASVVFDGAMAVNKCRWNAVGSVIAAGDAGGRVHICEVDTTLATPRADDWTRLVRTIADVKADRADTEDVDSGVSTTGVSSLGSSMSQSPMR
jgi:dynein intermediate chain